MLDYLAPCSNYRRGAMKHGAITPHRPFILILVLLLTAVCAMAQQPSLDLGTIDFSTSADGDAQDAFLTGALALHSFWYEEARDHFRKARELDPSFAMAYWGETMTHDHPLWNQHDAEEGRAILRLLDQQNRVRGTDRELAYVNAVRTLFNGSGGIDDRRRAYADEMSALADQYPDDDEAALFSALAEMSLRSFDFNATYDVEPVAARLEAIYKENPRHPGAIHYLIHVYDSGTFAPLGLRSARDYANIAPASSHALHMPSHIFRELEMWDEMAASNVDAYQASVDWQQQTGRPLRMRDFHALEWLFDAYLELGRLDDAEEIVNDLRALESEAGRDNEDLGRIPSLKERLQRRLDQAVD